MQPAGSTPPANEGLIDGNTGEFWKESNDEGLPFLTLDKDTSAGTRVVTFLSEPSAVVKTFGGKEKQTFEIRVKTLNGEHLLTLTSKRLRAALRQAYPDGKLVGRKAEIAWSGLGQARKYAVKPQAL